MKSYLQKYLDKVISRGNKKLAESISVTAGEIGNKYLKKFSFKNNEIGLLFGNIQSGKTGQMFGIICQATDLGFPLFILLTTDNVVLQQQTLNRVKSDLDGYCICGENDAKLFTENNLETPTIVVLKKNARILKLWANIFSSTGFTRGNPLFIIDDEADAASLNTYINQKKQSSINKYLTTIRNGASSCLYLQVTGTPQAVLLQTKVSGWRPLFTHYFSPGKEYLGGDFFFPREGKPSCVTFLGSLQQVERKIVIRHLLVSAHLLLSGCNVSNCLVHPSVRQSAHQHFALQIKKELKWCQSHLNDEFVNELKKQYEQLPLSKSIHPPFNQIVNAISKLFQTSKLKIIVMNGKTEVECNEYSDGVNFIIGGNSLGRGVTFPSLHTLYYTRTAKQPQADTMWQHSRMFGYDRDPELMMVYLDERLYKLFADINDTNNSIISQIEHGIDDIKIYYPGGLNPTRKNVLDADHVTALSGDTNYYPFSPKNDTFEQISEHLASFSEKEPFYQVSLRMIKDILSHIIPSSDFRLSSFVAILNTFLAEKPTTQGVLIVRRNRDVAQGTGALLSADDWRLGKQFTDKVVLTIYQVTGTKGWGGKPLWVPNIKLPKGTIYYDVIED
ncbi:MAG: Z1 domain-containing protein [Thermoguttaceae bacterium]